MEQTTVLPFPNASVATDVDLAEVEAGVALVSRGFATRVRLVGLPDVEAVAAAGLALAQASNVAFALDRSSSGTVAVTFGPRADP